MTFERLDVWSLCCISAVSISLSYVVTVFHICCSQAVDLYTCDAAAVIVVVQSSAPKRWRPNVLLRYKACMLHFFMHHPLVYKYFMLIAGDWIQGAESRYANVLSLHLQVCSILLSFIIFSIIRNHFWLLNPFQVSSIDPGGREWLPTNNIQTLRSSWKLFARGSLNVFSRLKAKGNILRTEGKKFSMMIYDASHYLFCSTGTCKPKQNI